MRNIPGPFCGAVMLRNFLLYVDRPNYIVMRVRGLKQLTSIEARYRRCNARKM